jgi:glycosyltransferase involved in cell wall biosynthesis
VGLVRMLIALFRQLRSIRPDVVICFQHYGNVIGALAARLAGVRTVIANRTTPHEGIPLWLDAIDLALGMMGIFTRVVVNSGVVEQEYRSYPGRYRQLIERIDHGFEPRTTKLDRQGARGLLGLPADIVLIGSVARLHATKNLAAAIRLLQADPRWHLAVAGQGPERADLEQLAQSLGVADRVNFVGELPPEQIGVFLRGLDVFVFPSLSETFGLAVVEAAAAGIPVVANDLTVLREVLAVDDEACALFVDANDTEKFRAAVQSVLQDKDLSARLTSRGAVLTQRYSLAAMADRYFALIVGA